MNKYVMTDKEKILLLEVTKTNLENMILDLFCNWKFDFGESICKQSDFYTNRSCNGYWGYDCSLCKEVGIIYEQCSFLNDMRTIFKEMKILQYYMFRFKEVCYLANLFRNYIMQIEDEIEVLEDLNSSSNKVW